MINFLVVSEGCKQCFHCYNECVQCTYTDSLQMLTHVLCKDSFDSPAQYFTAVSADTSNGYICASAFPTYTHNFCVNKPGEDNYPDYYNKGKKINCDEK